MPNYVYPTWDELESHCINLYSKMVKDTYIPDVVVALMDGGAMAGLLISKMLRVKLEPLDVNAYDNVDVPMDTVEIAPFYGDITGKNILIVDDIWDSGRTMRAVKNYFYIEAQSIRMATMFLKEGTIGEPNYHSALVKQGEWIVFPWERH
jgi:hypoxanthine phosphoribosyltransferase